MFAYVSAMYRTRRRVIVRWMEVKQEVKSLLSVERVDKALSVVGTLRGDAN